MRPAALRDRPSWATPQAPGSGHDEGLADLPIGVLILDADARVRVATPRLHELLGDVRDEPPPGAILPAARTADGRLLSPDSWPVHETLQMGTPVDELVVEFARQDGSTRALRVAAHPHRIPGDDRPGAIMLLEDVTERRERAVLRDDFPSILAHELRTPIMTIYTAVHLLRGGRLEPDARHGLLDDVVTQADALHQVIEDLVVMTRNDDPRGAVEIEPVLVRRVIDRAIADARRHWPDTRFVADVPRTLPPVRADELRLHQVLRNLIANGVKYGGARGDVTVRAVAGDGAVVIQVEDEGPGIPAAFRDRVFELFFRAPGRTDVGGSGIGLYIVRRLVEAMDGRVWIPDRPGGGSAVAVSLPVLDEGPERG